VNSALGRGIGEKRQESGDPPDLSDRGFFVAGRSPGRQTLSATLDCEPDLGLLGGHHHVVAIENFAMQEFDR
jgi:hypothetical protein